MPIDAPAHPPKAFRARLLVHIDDVAAGHAQAVAHAVVARGESLAPRCNRPRVFACGNDTDDLGAGRLERARPRPRAGHSAAMPGTRYSSMPILMPLTDVRP